MVTLSTLDPRSPLVLDTRELGRRPGNLQRVRRSVPAPADLQLAGVVGVAEGVAVELDLRLESVVEGVLVSGTARAALSGECARCLDPVGGEVLVDLQELFVFPGRAPEGPDADDEERQVQGDHVDLEPVLRDAVVLALPQAPVCRESCPGLCAECGARLADDRDHAHDTTDLRWAPLSGLLAGDRNEPGPTGTGPTEES